MREKSGSSGIVRAGFLGGQLGVPGVHGGGVPPSAVAMVHVPTRIAAARNSLIIRFTFISPVRDSHVESVNAASYRAARVEKVFSVRNVKQK